MRHFRRHWPQIRRSREFSRGLLGTFAPRKGTPGRCRWCGLRTERKLRWHQECVSAYRAATGQSVTHLWPHWDRPGCPCGEPGEELDHEKALVLAWTSGERRRILRAHRLGNLVWLCGPCHRAKTARDLELLAEMRSRQTCLMGLLPQVGHPMGTSVWASLEGGLMSRLEFVPGPPGTLTAFHNVSHRRRPVTFRPEKTTCPRCLVAMEHTGRGKYGLDLGMPQGWHLDEPRARLEAQGGRRTMAAIRQQERRAEALSAGQLMMDIIVSGE